MSCRAITLRLVRCRVAVALVALGATGASAAGELPTLYVISTHHRGGAVTPDELVRMIDGQIVERTELGFAVSYGVSRRLLGVATQREEEYELRFWDLASGKLESQLQLKLPIGFMRPHFGVFNQLQIDAVPGQVLYSSMTSVDQIEFEGDRRTIQQRQFMLNVAVDLAARRAFQVEAAAVDPLTTWTVVGNQAGLRMIDGGFAIYDPQRHTISGVRRFEGLARDWNAFVPGVGLIGSTDQEVLLLSDPELRPLERPQPLAERRGGVVSQGFFKRADGHTARYELKQYTSQDELARRAEDAVRSVLAIDDLTAGREQLKQEYPFAARNLNFAADGAAWYLEDPAAQRGITIDERTGKTTAWYLSWAEERSVVPYFGD